MTGTSALTVVRGVDRLSHLATLIAKLEAWREYDFHADYELSDEVLIADGWKCEPDAAWEGGVRWFHGTNPQFSTSENTRPRLILDLNTALSVVPHHHGVCLMIMDDGVTATVWTPGNPAGHEGKSTIATVAVLIAALKAKLVQGEATCT